MNWVMCLNTRSPAGGAFGEIRNLCKEMEPWWRKYVTRGRLWWRKDATEGVGFDGGSTSLGVGSDGGSTSLGVGFEVLHPHTTSYSFFMLPIRTWNVTNQLIFPVAIGLPMLFVTVLAAVMNCILSAAMIYNKTLLSESIWSFSITATERQLKCSGCGNLVKAFSKMEPWVRCRV